MKRKEFFDGTVVCLFDIVRKITGGQLILTSVVSYTLATDPFARARVVGAIAAFFINLDLAFHKSYYLGRQKESG